MKIDEKSQKRIIHILTDIFPGTLLYYVGQSAKKSDAYGKLPEIDIALDLGRIIGQKDLQEAQRALAETDIPYTIFLFDLQAVSEHERKKMIEKAQAWKL